MKIIFSLMCMSLLLISSTINEQIHALENASPKERVALMNHIKEQLIEMNHAERMNTIASLQEKLYVKHEQNQQEDLGNGQNKSLCKESNKQAHRGRNLEPHERQEQMLNHQKREENRVRHQRENRLEQHNGSRRNSEGGR